MKSKKLHCNHFSQYWDGRPTSCRQTTSLCN